MAWEQGTDIRRVDNPGKVGTATGKVRPRGVINYIYVQWRDGSGDWVAEDQLEPVNAKLSSDPYELIENGRLGRAEDLRRSLTHVHLSGRLANLIYAMGVTNTQFFAHQYKPLLTLLESPADGLLIADEVGLGKTIEAGIIWTELRAREDMRRLLIVCPAMLREKWRDELKLRFGIDASIVNAGTLADELKHSSSNGPAKAWISSYQALRPPKTWRPGGDETSKRPSARAVLANLLDDQAAEDPLIDMVVFDEAHYMRNPESAAHTLGEMLREVSHYRILLSATPINLANEDLYYLLRLCDPDHFQFPSSFRDMLSANRPLVLARDAALRRNASAAEIMEQVTYAASSQLLVQSRQLAAIIESPPTDDDLQSAQYRAERAPARARVNGGGLVGPRTRKRDVQMERPRREVTPEIVPMTDAERRFYVYVTEVTRDYAWRRGISDGFLLATPQRQVCSCPAAFARAWLGNDPGLLDDMAQHVLLDSEEGGEDEELEEINSSLKEFLVANRPRDLNVEDLVGSDPKPPRLLTVVGVFSKHTPRDKVILFTSFRATALYLTERLKSASINPLLLWGNMQESKQDLINEFRERPELRILVSTEVAAEGVDLQFCRLLINYDLPWNPMRVEQRIGRIDRLGQQSKVIYIWNLLYESTIDERILGRLLTRLKIFEEALGEPEPIVGETIRKLESTLLTSRLTPAEEEAEIIRAEQAFENVRLRQEDLERNAAQMIAHGGLVLDRISAAHELSRRVTESDLMIYVRDFLSRHAPGHQFSQTGESDQYAIQLPVNLAAELDDYCRRTGLIGQTLLGSGMLRTCRFLNSVTSSSNRSWEPVHQFHPLIRFIADKLGKLDEAFYPVVAVRIASGACNVADGVYMFAIRRWTFKGVKDEEWLQSAACSIEDGELLSDDMADAMINVARVVGRDWIEASNVVPASSAADCLDRVELYLEAAYQRAKKRKEDENTDRLMFQLHGIDQHLATKLDRLTATRDRHVSFNRVGLMKATQGRIDKLRATLGLKREQVQQRGKVVPDHELVCAGLLKVGECDE
jgi:superfamily II DNA or RNA helicase